MQRHSPGIGRLGNPAQAEDAVRETFLSASKAGDNFERRAGLNNRALPHCPPRGPVALAAALTHRAADTRPKTMPSSPARRAPAGGFFPGFVTLAEGAHLKGCDGY